MLGAGLLAKKAVELGLKTKSYIKTSLSPGSGVVTYYLEESGVKKYLEQLGLVVYCSTVLSLNFKSSTTVKIGTMTDLLSLII